VAHAGQVIVRPAVIESVECSLAVLWLAGCELLPAQRQVSAQPVAGLPPPAGAGRVGRRVVLGAAAPAGHARGGGGLVAMASTEVVGQFRVKSEGLLVERCGGGVQALVGAQLAVLRILRGVGRLAFALANGRQKLVQFDPALGLLDPLLRGPSELPRFLV